MFTKAAAVLTTLAIACCAVTAEAQDAAGRSHVIATASDPRTCSTDGCSLNLTPTIYVLNNQWGHCGCGTQSIATYSPTSWSTTWNYAGDMNWKIRSYVAAIVGWQFGWVDSGTGLPVRLSSHTPIRTTASYTVTGATTMDVAYDCWFTASTLTEHSTTAGEMMIWVADYGGLIQTGTPATVTIDGVTWDAYPYPADRPKLVQFVLHGGKFRYDLHAVHLNITDFTDFAVKRGWYADSEYIESVEFGTELYNPGAGTLAVTDYTASVGDHAAAGTPRRHRNVNQP